MLRASTPSYPSNPPLTSYALFLFIIIGQIDFVDHEFHQLFQQRPEPFNSASNDPYQKYSSAFISRNAFLSKEAESEVSDDSTWLLRVSQIDCTLIQPPVPHFILLKKIQQSVEGVNVCSLQPACKAAEDVMIELHNKTLLLPHKGLALSTVCKQTSSSTNRKLGELDMLNLSLILELRVVNFGHWRPGLHEPRLHRVDILLRSLHSTKQQPKNAYTPETVPCGVFMHQPTSLSRVASACVNFRNHTPAINREAKACLALFQTLQTLHLAIEQATWIKQSS